MTRKVHYTWKDIEHMVGVINNLMFADGWRPDYIVGLTRGGLCPAVIMSNMTGITMHTLDVRFRDTNGTDGPESNLWMAEDAYGYDDTAVDNMRSNADKRKKILIIDDINDQGNTLNWIKQDWRESCVPDSTMWEYIWGENVRVATLVDNMGSTFEDVDYTALEIDKREDPTWVVFPWEGERLYGSV